MKTKYDLSKVPRDLLEQFIIEIGGTNDNMSFSRTEAQASISQIRGIARINLRTRAEVDAEIAKFVRDYTRDVLRDEDEPRMPSYKGLQFREGLFTLTQEETAD